MHSRSYDSRGGENRPDAGVADKRPAGLQHVHLAALNELDVVAILVELRYVPLPARYLLFGKQDIRHGDGAKSSLADEASVIGALL